MQSQSVSQSVLVLIVASVSWIGWGFGAARAEEKPTKGVRSLEDLEDKFGDEWTSQDPAILPSVKPLGTQPTQNEAAQVRHGIESSAFCVQAVQAKDPVGSSEVATPEPFEDCKGEYEASASLLGGSGPDSCTDDTKVVCAYDSVYHVQHYLLSVVNLNQIVVKTYNLQSYEGPGGTTVPDTLTYLMRCLDANCTYGDTLVIDDDGNSETPCDPGSPGTCYDSKIVFTPTATGTYRVVVASYYQGREGFADVSVTINGWSPVVYTNRFFGGYHVRDKEVRQNDVLLVGKNSNDMGMDGNPEYHDSTLLYLTNGAASCAARCGTFRFNDDTTFGSSTLRLSRMDIPSNYGSSVARILVGVFDRVDGSNNPYRMNARLVHVRRHTSSGGWWSGPGQEDHDGDGLTAEVESGVGSCDQAADAPPDGVGVQYMRCSDFEFLVNDRVNQSHPGLCPSDDAKCWHPWDSDNDGLRDDWEVWAAVVKRAGSAPVGPYYACDDCASIPLLQATTCPTGHYCTALPLSALSDPDPSRYDVFFVSDYWKCTGSYCAADHSGGSTQHSVTQDQQDLLPRVWTDDPGSCWDGRIPTTVYPCDDPQRDLPYKVAMHLYNGRAHLLPDDTAAFEFGANGTRSYFSRWFDSAKKYTHVFRYALATHMGGGQSGTRTMVWGNWLQESPVVVTTFSHETGHLLGLNDAEPSDCGLQGQCPEAYNRCAPFFCSDGRNKAYGQNPNLPSLMNYSYARLRPKHYPVPGIGEPPFDSCSESYLRFSKGLNPVLMESSVWETENWSWRAGKRVSEVFCFNDLNWCGSPANPYHPYCSGSTCRIDWDALRLDGTQPPEPYSFDISYGRWCGAEPINECCPQGQDCASLAWCAMDALEDRNEWLTMIALGKQNLGPTWADDFTIYQDSFNSANTGNYAGWDFTIQKNLQYENALYPHNLCVAPADCPTSGCRWDVCQGASDCKKGQQCLGSSCWCDSDDDCYSAWCDVSVGICRTDWGVCECAAHGDCPRSYQNVCLPNGVCNNIWLATDDNQVTRMVWARPPRESARFAGPGQGNYIRLVNSGSTSPIWTIGGDHEEFQVEFDFRFEGFSAGQTRQILVSSGSFTAAIVPCGSAACLHFSVPRQTNALYFPGCTQGRRIERHRWYRVRWSLRGASDHYVTVQAWDMKQGGYSGGIEESGCVYRSFPSPLPDTGDVFLGWNGQDDGYRLKALVDNVSLFNYRADGRPSECEDQAACP